MSRPVPILDQLENIRGKTLKAFEVAPMPGNKDAEETEQLTLFFTDGSRFRIYTNSNASKIAEKCKGLTAADVRVDLWGEFKSEFE